MGLLEQSPNYWARQASLRDLHAAVMAIDTWSEDHAALLDAVYIDRSARLIERTRNESQQGALELAAHLERVAHDRVRDQLDALDRPYFARWRLLGELLHRCAERLEVPHAILARKHVTDILHRVAHTPGGRLAQGQLDGLIRNEGQRSATLKMMEQWDLIERHPGPGNTRTITLTDLGRLAIGAPEPAAVEVVARTPAPPPGLERLHGGFTQHMFRPTASS